MSGWKKGDSKGQSEGTGLWRSLFRRMEMGDKGRPSHSAQFPDRRLDPGGGQSLLPGNKGQEEREQPQDASEKIWTGYWEKFLPRKGCSPLA